MSGVTVSSRILPSRFRIRSAEAAEKGYCLDKSTHASTLMRTEVDHDEVDGDD